MVTAAMTSRVLTVEEAAAELRKSKRWLLEWLRAHPRDAQGEPYYTPVGRDKILHQNDIARIECALREGIKCRSNSGRRGKVKRQILKSEGATSESMWKLAAELTNDPSLATRSERLKSVSKSTINTQLPSLHRIPGSRHS
jgi:hypothetical protein